MIVSGKKLTVFQYDIRFHTIEAAGACFEELIARSDVFRVKTEYTLTSFCMDYAGGPALAQDFEARWITRLCEERFTSPK